MSLMTLLLNLALAGATPPNAADLGGPLRLRNEFPFAAIFMSTPPLDARIPARRRLDVELTVANTYATPSRTTYSPAGLAWQASPTPTTIDQASLAATALADATHNYYLADVETTRLDLRFTQPLGRRGLFEVELPVKMHSSGFLDPVIDGWHGLFGFDPAARPNSPDNAQQVFFARGGDVLALGGQSGPALGDLTVRGLAQLSPVSRGWPAVAVSAAAKLPTGAASRLMGSGGLDVGAGLHLTHEAGPVTLHGTAGLNHHSAWRGMASVPVGDSLDLHGGLELRLSRRWSALAQLSLYGSPFVDSDTKGIGSAASCYGLGARYNTGACQLEAGWVENIVRSNSSHDFGLYAKARIFM